MLSGQSELPHFVRKQVEKASFELTQALPSFRLRCQVKGKRLLIQTQQPHPSKQESVYLPLALLDYQDGAWLLLFRTTNGSWQPVPDDTGGQLDEKIAQFLLDPYRLFWRQ